MLPVETRRLLDVNDGMLLLLLLPLEVVDCDDNSESLVDDANEGHRLVESSRLSKHLLVTVFFILGGNGEREREAAAVDDDCVLVLLLPQLPPTFSANAKSLLSRSSTT